MKKTSVLSKILRSVIFLINIGFIIWLLLCKGASYYDTSHKPSLLSLFSFTCFFAALGNLLFVLYWLLLSKKKARCLFSLATLIICWNVARPLYGFNYFGGNTVASADEGSLKVMTWNVHMFDLGEWTKDKTSKAKILKLIKDENPDILCLQEFYWDAREDSEPYTAILQQSGYPFVAFSIENSMRKNYITSDASKEDMIHMGHAIFFQISYPQ